MKIELTKFLNSISFALDYVEGEFLRTAMDHAEGNLRHASSTDNAAIQQLKVAPNHAKRVAVLTNLMAAKCGMDEETVYAVTHAALLHDCALEEYLTDEFTGQDAQAQIDLKSHCLAGEKIVSELPFYECIRSNVLYHHERADGMGPFGMHAEEIPAGAQLIHLADDLDTRFMLSQMDREKYQKITDFVNRQKGSLYAEDSVNAFLRIADYDLLLSITGEDSRALLKQLIPDVEVEVPVDLMRKMSRIFADITDYKSHFTWRHSQGIAQKAEIMGHFYGYSRETCDKLYIAGALHDIGKLFISSDILEKPGKLSGEEYQEIQNHAMGTWKLLEGIGGLEDITSWAANHHEKLDGSGYPYGRKAGELGPMERLMACLDIYQALVEERPYKAGLSHEEAMKILNKMGSAGQLDTKILEEIDQCFGKDDRSAAETAEAAEAKEAAAALAKAAEAAESPAFLSEPKEYTCEAWRCPVCGYIYEGSLPEDFICPQCEQPGSIFEQIGCPLAEEQKGR